MQLHRDREEFDAAGAELVVIGQGSPKVARHFKEQYGIEGLRLLVDPGRKTYKAAGTKVANVAELFAPQVVMKGLRAAASERVVQGRTQGHAAQLGGVLVVAPGGEIAWSHLARDAGDNPPNEDVLAAVREAASRS